MQINQFLLLATAVVLLINLKAHANDDDQSKSQEQEANNKVKNIQAEVFAKTSDNVVVGKNQVLKPYVMLMKLKFLLKSYIKSKDEEKDYDVNREEEIRGIETLIEIANVVENKCHNQYLLNLKSGFDQVKAYNVNIVPYYEYFKKRQFDFCSKMLEIRTQNGGKQIQGRDTDSLHLMNLVASESLAKGDLLFFKVKSESIMKGILKYMNHMGIVTQYYTPKLIFGLKVKFLFEGMCQRVGDQLNISLYTYDRMNQIIQRPSYGTRKWLATARVCRAILKGIDSKEFIDSAYKYWEENKEFYSYPQNKQPL